MTDGFKKLSKSFSTTAEDLMIRAQIARADGSGFQSIGFMRDRIDYVTEVDAEKGISGIALKNGSKIAVAMPYADLEKKIYFADFTSDPVLDLTRHTGAAVAAVQMPALAVDFTPAEKKLEGDKRPMEDVPLKIAVFVRKAETQNFRMFIFDEEDVDWSSVKGIDGRNGKSTKLTLDYGESPFDDDEIIFDMPRPKFMELYNLAKMNGDKELDLRDWTRRRDPDNTQPPPPLKGRSGPQPGY